MGLRKADEIKLCIAFAKHCEIYFPRQRGVLDWTHIANEGRSPQEGDKLKKMGVRAGWFDYEFIWHDKTTEIAFLEAKVQGRDYSDSQKRFISVIASMNIPYAKFETVEQGHNYLISWGIKPLQECKLFHEPNLQTWDDKVKLSMNLYKPK